MNRDEKAALVDEIAAQIEGSEAIFAIDYRGISVTEAAALRGNLREADTSFRVVKNRLTKLAAEKAGREELGELLEGPTALAFIRGDTAMAAKAISTFNREHDILAFKGGFMDGLTLDEETFASIARLPSRDVLNGQLAGVVASPLTGLVRGLGSMVSGLAVALQQIADQGLVSGEAPEAPSAEDVGADDSAGAAAAEDEDSEASAAASAGSDAPAEDADAASDDSDASPDGGDASSAGGAEVGSSPAAREDEESSSATGPAAEASEESAEESEAAAETSEQAETSNEQE